MYSGSTAGVEGEVFLLSGYTKTGYLGGGVLSEWGVETVRFLQGKVKGPEAETG